MKDSTEEIVKTFFDHEEHLKQLYDEQITQFVSSGSYFLSILNSNNMICLKFQKKSYRSKDLPYMVALDIVNERQLEAMAAFAESRLPNNIEESNVRSYFFCTVI